MIQRVCDNNVAVSGKAKTAWEVELTLPRAPLSKASHVSALSIENLDAVQAVVAHKELPLLVESYSDWAPKLAWPVAL